jgi:hypothetical protein
MNDDPRDVVRVRQAHGLPGRAAVDRLEDALAGIRRARIGLLAGADPDDLRIRRRDGDGSYGGHFDRVGDVLPGDAVVDRLPQAAGSRRGVDRVQVLPRLLLALPLVLLGWTFVQVLWVERAIDTDRDPIAPVVEE